MKEFSLYRRRIIPEECILLKGDEILSFDEDRLVTRWTVIHPRPDFSHGISCYFLDEGFKVSKFYQNDGSLYYWYIDIISHEWTQDENALTVTDLLADVIIYPDGAIRVVDLDELARALEEGKINQSQLIAALNTVNKLLQSIYNGSFQEFQSYIDQFE